MQNEDRGETGDEIQRRRKQPASVIDRLFWTSTASPATTAEQHETMYRWVIRSCDNVHENTIILQCRTVKEQCLVCLNIQHVKLSPLQPRCLYQDYLQSIDEWFGFYGIFTHDLV